MGFWEASCAVEEVSYKISSIKAVTELLAEKLVSEPESGVAWAITEMLEVYEARLVVVSEALMDAHKEAKIEPPRKGKKK